MGKKCVVCNEPLEEEDEKLKGTALRVRDETGKSRLIHICSGCQKKPDWIEKAKIKGA